LVHSCSVPNRESWPRRSRRAIWCSVVWLPHLNLDRLEVDCDAEVWSRSMRKTYGPDYPRTLSALMTWSDRDPEAPAVTDGAGTVPRRAFQERVLRVAAGLRGGGVGPGARVALWLPNGSDYLAAIFACARLGALVVHINTRFRTAEVGSLLRRSSAVALVTDWQFPPVDFPAIVAALPAEDRAALRCVFRMSAGATELAGLP